MRPTYDDGFFRLTTSRDGEKIRLEGEADQAPNQEPGDLIFILKQKENDEFVRTGNDLRATMEVTLAEALTGFSRVVIRHLDGRGIHLQYPREADPQVLQTDQFIKIRGEGMPIKKSDAKGDLFLEVHINMPEYEFLRKTQAFDTLKKILPGPAEPIKSDEVDEVDYEELAIDEVVEGAMQDEEEGWEDDRNGDEGEEGPQCQQQ